MSSDNLLLHCAAPLLNTIVQLRLAATHDDPPALRLQLVEEIRRFEQRGKQADIPAEMIIASRYCLCSALDEAAAQTPWGSRGIWSGNGLLVNFHNESWGGEKFFQILARASQAPHQHIWLLEIIHYCLLLGYEGRYRTLDNGRTQRDGIRNRLSKLIEETRGSPPTMLSPPLEARPRHGPLWRPPVPLWVSLTLTAFIACLIYSTFNWRLSEHAAQLLSGIYQMPLPGENDNSGAHRSGGSPSLLDLSKPLADLINEGKLEVIEGSNDSKVIISSAALFDAASSQLTPAGRALVSRVAVAMDSRRGAILVSAWAESRPPSEERFATNYEYTLAQARSVSAVLQRVMTQNPHSIRVEGRGNNASASSATRTHQRLLKRRIEVTLYPSPDNAGEAATRRKP